MCVISGRVVVAAASLLVGVQSVSTGLRHVGQHHLSALSESVQSLGAGAPREYQCASEAKSTKAPCPGCAAARTCYCDGMVRFGADGRWTSWVNTSGTVDCSSTTFGDPAPNAHKVCICRPQVYTCATEYRRPIANCPECVMDGQCACNGYVRFGYGSNWTQWSPVTGSVHCKTSQFGDPIPGQGKVCQCMPSDILLDTPTLYASDSNIALLTAIIIVTLTYFTIYTLLSCLRSMSQFRGDSGPIALANVVPSAVYLAPMLCALFFAARQRAELLTLGNPDFYGYPPKYVEGFALATAVAFAFQAFALVFAELAARGAQPGTPPASARFWMTVYHVAAAIMYAGVVIVIIAVACMRAPARIVLTEGYKPMSSGALCTLVLAVAYFAVYLILHYLKVKEVANYGLSGHSSFEMEVFRLAATAMNFSPMLSILFMGVQIVASWQGITAGSDVDACIYICTFSVLTQLVLVLVAPFLSRAELDVPSGAGGEVEFVTRNRLAFVLISFMRWTAMLLLYACVFILCVKLWGLLEAPVLTHMLTRLSFVYFASYLMLWLCITVRVLFEIGLTRMVWIMTVMKETVGFCPMLSVLVLESFVRARRLTNLFGQKGVPQNYAQDCMLVAASALVAQLVVTIASGAMSRVPVGPGAQLEGEEKRYRFLPFFAGIFHLFLLVLFFAVCEVIWAIFTINPRNATAAGAWFV